LDGEAATATAFDIEANGGRADPATLDVSDPDQVARVIGRGPALTILCNVAGILTHAPVETLTGAELDRVLSVNLKGTLLCSQAALPGMRTLGGGTITNLASAAIDTIAPNLAAYSTSKAAIAQLTRSMAHEWAAFRVRVNAVAPGFIDTAMTAHSYLDDEGRVDERRRTELLDRVRAMTPLGITGQVDDVATCIWFLAADASRYMTGQILRPNGGIAMPW
jgi:3-oxoacyl-[acyl-carrier protein] reductase